MLGKLAALTASASMDAALIAGFALVAYGSWLIYEPAGYIIGGLQLIAAVLILQRAKRQVGAA